MCLGIIRIHGQGLTECPEGLVRIIETEVISAGKQEGFLKKPVVFNGLTVFADGLVVASGLIQRNTRQEIRIRIPIINLFRFLVGLTRLDTLACFFINRNIAFFFIS